jgi:peptidoglycan/LPS O-acetylase OafA/YrhL
MLATFAASIPLAWLAYSFVEKAGIALGKKLVGTMK